MGAATSTALVPAAAPVVKCTREQRHGCVCNVLVLVGDWALLSQPHPFHPEKDLEGRIQFQRHAKAHREGALQQLDRLDVGRSVNLQRGRERQMRNSREFLPCHCPGFPSSPPLEGHVDEIALRHHGLDVDVANGSGSMEGLQSLRASVENVPRRISLLSKLSLVRHDVTCKRR